MSQDQHYVPQAYLRRFLNANDKIYRLPKHIPKPPSRIKEFNTAGTGYLPDFYVVQDDIQLLKRGLEDVNHIEKHFAANQDTKCSELLERLLTPSGLVPTNEVLESLLLVLSLKHRNPSLRDDLINKERAKFVYNAHFPKLEAKLLDLRNTSYKFLTDEEFNAHLMEVREQMEARISHPDYAMNVHNEQLLSFFEENDTIVHQIATSLLRWTWYLYKTSLSKPFITSDNPGFTTDEKAQPHNLGFSEAYGFCFSLSPIYCLALVDEFDEEFIINNKRKRIRLLTPQDEWITTINKSTYVISYKYVYSHDEISLINTWHDLHPGFR